MYPLHTEGVAGKKLMNLKSVFDHTNWRRCDKILQLLQGVADPYYKANTEPDPFIPKLSFDGGLGLCFFDGLNLSIPFLFVNTIEKVLRLRTVLKFGLFEK